MHAPRRAKPSPPTAPAPPPRREARTEGETALLGYLGGIAERISPKQAPRSLETFLMGQGRFFDAPAGARPAGVPTMPPRDCFTNAATLAESKGWGYAEGYALRGFPTHHAWCVTPEGRVVDATWDPPGDAYFGVAIQPAALAAHLARTGRHGLFTDHWRPGVLEGVAAFLAAESAGGSVI